VINNKERVSLFDDQMINDTMIQKTEQKH